MQHKSIFAQTGRATYITLMTVQSQGGTTNETKCNYRPPPIWKQNKPSRTPIWGPERGDENKPSCRHRSVLQLAFLPLFRSPFRGLFITIPISWWLGHRSLPDIYELIKKKKKKRGRESQEVLSYWHSNSIPQKLSTRFSELLSQKTSELNKINAPASRPTSSHPPVSPFRRKNNAFHFLKSRRKKKRLCCLYLFLSHKVTSTLLQDYINVPWRLKWWGVTWVCSTLFFFSFWRK